MGIVIVLMLIYFVIRVIGIYKKEIGYFFVKIFKALITIFRIIAIRNLYKKLENLGYFNYTSKQYLVGLKKKIYKTGYFYWEETKRLYMSDAEDLAEGFIKEFYQKIEPFLSQEGVIINSYEQMETENQYEITVNNRDFLIFDGTTDNYLDAWEICTNRSFSVINLLLQESGSDERIFALYGGNELFALFLTEEMYKYICESKIIHPRDKPLRITN